MRTARARTTSSDDRAPGQAQPPATATEQVLHEIWCDVLEIDGVGISDNFFDVGGYSLLLHVVRDRIARRMNVRPSMTDLFEHPSIRALGRFLDGIPAARPVGPTDDDQRLNGRSRLARLRSRRAPEAGDDRDSLS
ncbi:phosphopantetheine-binding protein [Actinosynnema sp. NPDC023794]